MLDISIDVYIFKFKMLGYIINTITTEYSSTIIIFVYIEITILLI